MGAEGRKEAGTETSRDIARRFVDARLAARSLPDFPGPIPAALAEAYATQEAALALWPDRVAGWKVGLIAPAMREVLGAERIAGPIFARHVWPATPGASLALPVISGGFAAVEGEVVLRLGRDAGPRADWTAAEARGLVDQMFIGVELAGSPLATINDLGSTVVASDFGNNAGLILGPAVADWQTVADEALVCETFIDGASVGTGKASGLPGGPMGALAFLLNNLAVRGRPARAGDLISTGAVSGVHDIVAGQSARIDFGAFGDILCHAEMARPEPV